MKPLNTPTSSKNTYYMYGYHPVIAAIRNPNRDILKILCTLEVFKKDSELISLHLYEILASSDISKIIGPDKLHQGLAIKTKSIFSEDLSIIFDGASDQNIRIAILDQITDSQNIGAIIRSAAAFGIKAIILPQNNSPIENGTIAKVACGALEQVKIIQVVNLKSAMDKLKKQNFWIMGLSVNAKEMLSKKIISGNMAFVLGSEDKGMRQLTESACDYLVKIPISQNVESINVANTAAIMFYISYSLLE